MMCAALNFVAAGLRCGLLIGGPNGFEESFGAEFYGVGDFGWRARRVLENDAGFSCPRQEKTDAPAAWHGMRPEKPKGVGVACREQGIDARVQVRARLLFR